MSTPKRWSEEWLNGVYQSKPADHMLSLRNVAEAVEASVLQRERAAVEQVIAALVAEAQPYGFSREDVLGMLAKEAQMLEHMAQVSVARDSKKMMLSPDTATRFARLVSALLPSPALPTERTED